MQYVLLESRSSAWPSTDLDCSSASPFVHCLWESPQAGEMADMSAEASAKTLWMGEPSTVALEIICCLYTRLSAAHGTGTVMSGLLRAERVPRGKLAP